jgi:hypothetical protein
MLTPGVICVINGYYRCTGSQNCTDTIEESNTVLDSRKPFARLSPDDRLGINQVLHAEQKNLHGEHNLLYIYIAFIFSSPLPLISYESTNSPRTQQLTPNRTRPAAQTWRCTLSPRNSSL